MEKIASNGQRHVFACLNDRDLLGLSKGPQHSVSAYSLTSSTLIEMPTRELEHTLCAYPEILSRYHKILLLVFGIALNQMFLLGQKNALQRMAYFLHDFKLRMQSTEFALPMSRRDIADHLGISIETASRALAKLQEMSLIQISANRHVRIDKPAALKKYSEEII